MEIKRIEDIDFYNFEKSKKAMIKNAFISLGTMFLLINIKG